MSIARRCDICGRFYSLEISTCNNGMLLPDRDGMGHYILCKVVQNGESQTLMQYDICDECSNMIWKCIQDKRELNRGPGWMKTCFNDTTSQEEQNEHI